jgi:hypothetical protein
MGAGLVEIVLRRINATTSWNQINTYAVVCPQKYTLDLLNTMPITSNCFDSENFIHHNPWPWVVDQSREDTTKIDNDTNYRFNWFQYKIKAARQAFQIDKSSSFQNKKKGYRIGEFEIIWWLQRITPWLPPKYDVSRSTAAAFAELLKLRWCIPIILFRRLQRLKVLIWRFVFFGVFSCLISASVGLSSEIDVTYRSEVTLPKQRTSFFANSHVERPPFCYESPR